MPWRFGPPRVWRQGCGPFPLKQYGGTQSKEGLDAEAIALQGNGDEKKHRLLTEAMNTECLTTLEVGAGAEDLLAPVTRPFMEALFDNLCEDNSALQNDVASDIKEGNNEVLELGHMVAMLEMGGDAWEEEIEDHRGECLELCNHS
ncbi:hypothetical protein NDU88_006215 [Pleurodeles waltl]|uniref:Uncharacterized protein n=1 Tax=Pleurodeles waltl TaxID=8319 RepID=A0AAV7N811_PLEWA|nr:hypothetical protein NDU88_006215 [Pleurodeles waltl]